MIIIFAFSRSVGIFQRNLKIIKFCLKCLTSHYLNIKYVLLISGYGNISPHTPMGKITTIVYAIIGMPLFLLYLSNIGDIMARSFKWIYANCCLCRWCPGVAKRRALRRIKREQKMSMEYDSEEQETDNSDQSNTVSYNANVRLTNSESETVLYCILELKLR